MPRQISELATVFEKIAADVGIDAVRKSALEAAEVIRAQAEANAPVRTGKLRKNILKRTLRGSTIDSVEIRIGPAKDAFYGVFTEFGTAHQPARPFLGPAVAERGEEAARIFGEELRRRIEKHASGD